MKKESSATKNDIRKLGMELRKEIGGVMAELRKETAGIRHEMATKKELAELRKEMATKKELAELRKEMATKKDLAALREEMVTRKEMESAINWAIQKSEERTDERARKYRDEILTATAEVIGELKAMREEHAVLSGRVYEDHEERIVKLEDAVFPAGKAAVTVS